MRLDRTQGTILAYRTVNPFTQPTVRDFSEHTYGEVKTALAAADALYHSVSRSGKEGRIPG